VVSIELIYFNAFSSLQMLLNHSTRSGYVDMCFGLIDRVMLFLSYINYVYCLCLLVVQEKKTTSFPRKTRENRGAAVSHVQRPRLAWNQTTRRGTTRNGTTRRGTIRHEAKWHKV